ncbi:MAG: NAD(P)-dependent oxidoreductase [Paracoccaceae bacterium]
MKYDQTYIGFVGLGAMGSVMAPLISRAGFNLITFDKAVKIRTEKNLLQAKSLNELLNCNFIFLMLPDGIVVREIALELVTNGFKGQLIDMSSCDPNQTIELGNLLKTHGISLIDAPVSGGVKKAALGSLMIMVGGRKENLSNVKSLLDLLGTVVHIGPLGAGHAMKALNNYVSASGLLASMQALATAETYGIRPQSFIDVINDSTGKNNSTEVKLKPYVIPRSYSSGFSLKLMTKDVEVASLIMQNGGFSTPLSDQLPHFLKNALESLESNADHTALYEHINPKKHNS